MILTHSSEVIAESLKKPVLAVSSGELGKDQMSIEANLKTFVSYATIWKAVVLIDEADVFLEARQSGSGNSLWTNGLVAGTFLPSVRPLCSNPDLSTKGKDKLTLMQRCFQSSLGSWNIFKA